MTGIAVFDLDGTLVDTAPDLAASLNHCLAAAGMAPMPLEVVRPHAGHGAKVMLQEAYRHDGRTLDEAEMAEQVTRFIAHYQDHIAVHSRLFPGVRESMDRLEASGMRLAICTNKYERLAGLLLTELAVAHRFAAICGADTFARRKPDPLHLRETIARAGGRMETSVMIGDTVTDIDTAVAARVPSVLVDFGYAPDAAARSRASVIIQDYEALDIALVNRLVATAGGGTGTDTRNGG
ncbi:HAD family hydrolase [Aurantimonas sp. A2-1-M11]|uniref:HAD family hydrolase n=1 Tax=Aurantimonas sp. A2-1-M11 TaxID=3113712 RepID=UPI002F9288F8